MKVSGPCLPFWKAPVSTTKEETTKSSKVIEDFRPGYPRFSALLSAQPSFFVCRRFDRLRARVLLLKQDKLSLLEQQLDEIDENEKCAIFLGKSRCDSNADRAAVLAEIEDRLGDYGTFQYPEVLSIILIRNRQSRGENFSYFQPWRGQRWRHHQLAKLAGWHWLPGPGGKSVFGGKSLGAGLPCAGSGQCDVAAGDLGGDEARSTLSKISKGKLFFLRELIWTDRKSRTAPRKSRLIVMSSSTREA